MRRPSPSHRLSAAFLTAALLWGAAVAFAPRPARACTIEPQTLEEAVRGARMVLIASVASAGGGSAELRPEAYLKGAASARPVRIDEFNAPGCDFPSLAAGQRILVLLSESDGRLGWPTFSQLYLLDGGRSVGGPERSDAGTEADLVARVRGLTNQYAVPAASEGQGVGIDWRGTVIPVSIALLCVFGVGLVLMRIWHRIDPT